MSATVEQVELLMKLYRPDHGTGCLCDTCTPMWEAHGLADVVLGIRIDIDEHNARLDELAAMPYDEYLRTEEWQFSREMAFVAKGRRCALCNSPERLNVHHRVYRGRGIEHVDDLTVLCRDCHQAFHETRELTRG